MAAVALPAQYEFRTILRHRWPLRAMHWINLLCMLALVGSGLRIFNAHPALYWGQTAHFDTPLFATQAMPGTSRPPRSAERPRPVTACPAATSPRTTAWPINP